MKNNFLQYPWKKGVCSDTRVLLLKKAKLVWKTASITKTGAAENITVFGK